VLLEFLKDTAKLALIVVMVFVLLGRYLRWKKPNVAAAAEQHRLFLLLILGAVLVGIKVSEEALSGGSGPMDKAFLLFLHQHVPANWTPFFELITLTGSFKSLFSLVVITSLAFLACKRRFEMLLLASSAICGALIIYLLKLVTGRERPALWETRWYWGTSFPSGHTLETTCFAMALTLCLSPIWPSKVRLMRLIALGWVILVGWSRLVLGVHWPSDVLVAVCIGMLIPIAVQYLLIRLGLHKL
jgi:membrane-associated phospholipid phosphatase